jgi:1-acyl-sn-glycerol-3-phosphate acyltransferase
VRRALGRLVLRSLGWRAVGEFPRGCERCVLIAAPHTSNWDLAFMIAFAMAFDLQVSWMGKHTLFRGSFGALMGWLGGIPVRRDIRSGMVEQMAKLFDERRQLVLAIAPEGTRFRAEHWKAGFYRIAERARVPIVPSYLDFGTRTAGFGPPLLPSPSLRADMDQLRAVYAGKRGLFADRFGPVRLIEETRDLAVETRSVEVAGAVL